MEEVIIDGRKYISARQAAEITKYSQDYIGQLVRAGTLSGRLIGRARFVEEEALLKYSNTAKFHNQNLSELKIEKSEQPEESKISDHVFAEPTGYSHGWQSRSPFDSAVEINIVGENPQERVFGEKISQIKNLSRPWRSGLPYTTAFISMLLVVSGLFVLFSSSEINSKISYTAKTETSTNQTTNQTASLVDAGIFGDISSSIKKGIDSLALQTYKNVSAGGNRLASFLSGLFGGAKQNIFAIFTKKDFPPTPTEESKIEKNLETKPPSKLLGVTKMQVPVTGIPTETLGESSRITPTPAQGRSPDRSVGVERIIERVVEKVPATIVTTETKTQEASSTEVDSKLEQLKNKVFSEIYKVADGLSTKTNTVYQAVSLTNKIDNLNKVTISDATISGSTYSGSVTGTSGSFSSSLSANGGLSATTGSFSGDLTVLGAPTFSGVLTIPYFTATSTTATSTVAGQFLNTFVPSIAHTFGAWSSGVSGSNPLTASVMINPASATADSNLFSLSVGNSAKFLIDAEGDVFANSLTASGGVTLSTTTASTFSVENNSTFGDSTTTDRTYFNSRIGSSLIPNTNNLLDIGDTTNWLSWRTGLFGTSVGIGGTATSTGSQLTSSGTYLIDSGGILSLNTTNNQNIVTGTGNFGIGTTSPYAKLSVVGPAIAEYFYATSTTATSTFAGGLSVAGSSGLTVLQNGLVGIGTSSPYAKFSVWGVGTTAGQLFELTNSASTTIARFLDNGIGYLLGNLGIGTTSPYAALSVVGETVSTYFTATSTTATSTFAGGLKLSKAGTGVEFSDGTIQTIAPRTPSIQVFTSSGTWTKPSGVTKIKVTVAGGGGGGGSYSGGIYGSGGGGGGACIEYINVSAVSSVSVTIGAAGNGSLGGAGASGGESFFGAYCSASGGTGGGPGLSNGGGGGVGSGGDLNIRGNPGMDSYGTNPAHGGGGSVFAGGAVAGTANATYGGGGGSGYPEGTAGAAGVVVVEEY